MGDRWKKALQEPHLYFRQLVVKVDHYLKALAIVAAPRSQAGLRGWARSIADSAARRETPDTISCCGVFGASLFFFLVLACFDGIT